MSKFKYLIRDSKQKVAAHYWNGNDTLCRMYSTGGLKKEKFSVHDESHGKRICQMCVNNAAKQEIPV